MLASFGLPVALVGEVGEVGMALGSANDDAAAMAAVPAIGPASRRVLLSPEAEAAVAARSALHENGHSIDEHVLNPRHDVESVRRPPWSNMTLPLITE